MGGVGGSLPSTNDSGDTETDSDLLGVLLDPIH